MTASPSRPRAPSVSDPATGLPVGPPVDARPALRPGRDTVLAGRFVEIAPIDPARDAPSLFAASHGSDRDALWLHLGASPASDLAGFRAYLEAGAAVVDPFLLAIRDRRSGEAVGHAALMRMEPADRAIEVGNILFTPAMQRGPAGTEAIFLLARHVFETLGNRRFEWKCDTLNAPSVRAAERFGFTYEGTFRQHRITKGRTRDTAWFSMLDTEWPTRRTVFERWLDPANFDADGGQRLRLSVLQARTIPGHDLRRAGSEDGPTFGALQEAAYRPNQPLLGVEPLPLLVPPAEALARYETWLAEENGAVVGALALEPRPDHLLIWSVSTDPARQNGGLGRRLLSAAEDRARELGLRTIRLYTGAPLTKNIDWYARRGYATDRFEDGPDRRLVHMAKTID